MSSIYITAKGLKYSPLLCLLVHTVGIESIIRAIIIRAIIFIAGLNATHVDPLSKLTHK